jgi:ribose-phosphate pyrophosphokinase
VPGDFKVFSGSSNPELSQKIGEYLKIKLGKIKITHFPDGEILVKIEENVRGKDVFIIQSGCDPVNERLMELLIILDALKRASAGRVTAVMPYYCYARQDIKDEPRVPITAKLVADLISKAGASRLLTIDLHAPQIQGFFNIPVDHLYAAPVFVKYFKLKNKQNDYVVVSPDVGRVKRSRAFARRLDMPLAIIDKRRPTRGKAQVMHVIGEIENKNAIILDDIIDTGGTVLEAARALKEGGAKEIYVGATHPVLSKGASEKIKNSPLIKELVVTDTIPLKGKQHEKIKVLSVAPLFGEAIRRIHRETSVSDLLTRGVENGKNFASRGRKRKKI